MRLFSLLLTSFFTLAAADVTDDATGESFPSTISFDVNGKTTELQAAGVATRKKFFVKVYSAALYLQDAASFKGKSFADILSSDNAKQLTMKWVHDVDLQKLQEGYRESLKSSLGSQYEALKSQVDAFLNLYKSGAKVGDEHILRFLPDGSVDLTINGTAQGNIKDAALAKGVLSIWLGDKSVLKRDGLISLIK